MRKLNGGVAHFRRPKVDRRCSFFWEGLRAPQRDPFRPTCDRIVDRLIRLALAFSTCRCCDRRRLLESGAVRSEGPFSPGQSQPHGATALDSSGRHEKGRTCARRGQPSVEPGPGHRHPSTLPPPRRPTPIRPLPPCRRPESRPRRLRAVHRPAARAYAGRDAGTDGDPFGAGAALEAGAQKPRPEVLTWTKPPPPFPKPPSLRGFSSRPTGRRGCRSMMDSTTP